MSPTLRYCLALILLLVPGLAPAQQRDGVFASYDAYAGFVDQAILSRDFYAMITNLGGRDEYTPEELAGLNTRFRSIYQSDFDHSAVIRSVDLGNGFHQEARVYWRKAGGGYLFFYAMLHQRTDALVVLTFNANTDVDKIMALF